MRLQTGKNKLFAALMSVLAAVSLLVLYIPAAASADNSSVSLICESGSKAVADMHWSIYRIGEKIDNEYVVIINESSTPHLTISSYYKGLLGKAEKDQQLADYLSVERSAMSAELSEVARQGYLITRKNHFILLKK